MIHVSEVADAENSLPICGTAMLIADAAKVLAKFVINATNKVAFWTDFSVLSDSSISIRDYNAIKMRMLYKPAFFHGTKVSVPIVFPIVFPETPVIDKLCEKRGNSRKKC